MKWFDILFDPTPKAAYRYQLRAARMMIKGLQDSLAEKDAQIVHQRQCAQKFFEDFDKACERLNRVITLKDQRIDRLEEKIESAHNKMAEIRKQLENEIAEQVRLRKELQKKVNIIKALRQNLAVVREQANNYAKRIRRANNV